jgi:hypothetical protein
VCVCVCVCVCVSKRAVDCTHPRTQGAAGVYGGSRVRGGAAVRREHVLWCATSAPRPTAACGNLRKLAETLRQRACSSCCGRSKSSVSWRTATCAKLPLRVPAPPPPPPPPLCCAWQRRGGLGWCGTACGSARAARAVCRCILYVSMSSAAMSSVARCLGACCPLPRGF